MVISPSITVHSSTSRHSKAKSSSSRESSVMSPSNPLRTRDSKYTSSSSRESSVMSPSNPLRTRDSKTVSSSSRDSSVLSSTYTTRSKALSSSSVGSSVLSPSNHPTSRILAPNYPCSCCDDCVYIPAVSFDLGKAVGRAAKRRFICSDNKIVSRRECLFVLILRL